MLLKASRFFDIPLERVEKPFAGRTGEGNKLIAYLRLPKKGSAPFPVLVSLGGIDGFNEEELDDPVLEHGLATIAIDGSGVGDSPLKGSENAERLFGAVFDWIGTNGILDSQRIGVWGYGTGG